MRVSLTGVANGIGAATAMRLCAKGTEVVGVDLSEGDRLKADLGDHEAIDALPLDGCFDPLINAAGLAPQTENQIKVLNVNFRGLRRLTERMLPHLSAGSAIVSLASNAGANWRENLGQVQRLISLIHPCKLRAFVAAEPIDTMRAYDL